MDSYIENMKCVLCKSDNVEKRLIEVEGDVLSVINLCEDCFANRIKPMIDENAENMQEVVSWFKSRRLLPHRDELIDSIEPCYISNLSSGIYRIKITVIDELFDSFANSPEDYLIDKTSIGLNNRINKSFLNQVNNKKFYIEDTNKNEEQVDLKAIISDTKINPNLILRREILANSQCPKCKSNLDLFLRQIKVGCSYCFVYFFDSISEYVNSIKSNIEYEEKNKEIQSNIGYLQTLKEEAVKAENWELAAKYRDEIKEIQKQVKGKNNE